MSRVITFSRTFPSYHPKAGEQTDFVQKIWKSIGVAQNQGELYKLGIKADSFLQLPEYSPKHHTVRAGHRWKVGDKFSPRVWSGKPYNSPQIIIAPDIEIKQIYDFEMNDDCEYYINGKRYSGDELAKVAKNDGLSIIDFGCWFAGKSVASSKRNPFDGQIICWSEKIKY